jgi:hypothetical protein
VGLQQAVFDGEAVLAQHIAFEVIAVKHLKPGLVVVPEQLSSVVGRIRVCGGGGYFSCT